MNLLTLRPNPPDTKRSREFELYADNKQKVSNVPESKGAKK